MKAKRVYIIGMMGAGKTTYGKKLAQHLKFDFFDLDKIIEKESKNTIANLFKNKGEAFFRSIETQCLIRFNNNNSLLATGGGTPMFSNNLNWILENGVVVWFHLPIKLMAQRIFNSKTERPLAKANTEIELLEKIEKIYEERLPIYKKAHFYFETKEVTKERLENLALEIKNQLR